MTLYSKNGSIPYPTKDETEGWIEVEEAPIAGEGEEVVWWYPPGWVIRDPQPGANWSWSQSEERWVEYQLPSVIIETQEIVAIESTNIEALASSQVIALTSEQISGL